MEKRITFVGLDAHKVAINVAMFLPGRSVPVVWECSNEKASVRRMVKKVLREAPGEVRFCYEAGPCGYALQRWIREAGCACVVVAPSLIPRKPGDRVKTDRRDAKKLGQLYQAGLLTEVHPPSEEDEAVRDLCRAREDAHEDLVRCRHRLSKLLLRRGWQWQAGKKAWGQGHRLWLRSVRLEHVDDQAVLDDYLLAIEQVEARLVLLDQEIERVSQREPYVEVVGRGSFLALRRAAISAPLGVNPKCLLFRGRFPRQLHPVVVRRLGTRLLYPTSVWKGVAAILGTTACFAAGSFPTTWEGRYSKAMNELSAAKAERDRFYALRDAAKAAFEVGRTDESRQHAQLLLELAARFPDDWNYGNAIHDGHMVLGRVALATGDVEAAKRELLLAGKTPGSPQLDTFGPNMSLARDLLQQEQVDTVVAYLELCGKFWEMEEGRLASWSALARSGAIPDFEANLLY